jgi:hypothetical protein
MLPRRPVHDCIDVKVVEFWRREPRGVKFDWERDPALEIKLPRRW